jgi:hypothetical protein
MSGVTRAPRSGRLIPPWPVGRYRQLGGISSSSGALTLNRLMLHPFIAAEDFSIDKLGSVITTAQAAGLTRYGFYEAEEADWYPKDLIADLGTVLCDSNGYKAVDCDIDFEADRCYWLASVLQGQAGVVGSRMVCQGSRCRIPRRPRRAFRASRSSTSPARCRPMYRARSRRATGR